MNDKSISHSIRGRLFFGFSIIGIVLLISIAIVLYMLATTEDNASKVIQVDLPTNANTYDLDLKIYQNQTALMSWTITQDPQYKTEILLTWNNITKLLHELDQAVFDTNNREYVQNWQDIKALFNKLHAETLKILNTTNATPQMVIATVAPITNKIFDIVDGPLGADANRTGGLFDIQFKVLEAKANAIISSMDSIRYVEYTLFVLTILAIVLTTVFTTRGIINYINIFRHHSNKVANGDLTQRISISSKDEMGQLGNDLNAMTENLSTITRQITDACHHMVTTIEEVKHSVDVQSAGASEQASSINEITSSLEEIEKSSNQTIEKAKTLGEVAERTREKGQLGLDAVVQSVNGMKSVRDKVQVIAQTILDLSKQTQQVGEITAVVNSLAQQSKMLALNASIEAVKAGDAGKGFAVVAAEVKNLAEQSEQSTAQVQKILEDIRHATEKAVMVTEEGTKGVDVGTHLVEQTGDVVRSLSEVIHETTIASQQIQAAIRQEGVGIEQITAGMNEINQVTASFVESVKQTTEAIDNLVTLVKSLKEYVDVYKI